MRLKFHRRKTLLCYLITAAIAEAAIQFLVKEGVYAGFVG